MSLKRGNVLEFEIQDLAFGGKGITKLPTPEGELVVFTPNTIPGQKVKARIFKKRKKFLECKLLEITERSPLETEFNYQPISGAPYITLPIEEQQKYKLKNTLELYKRIARVDNVDEVFDEFISSPSIFHYRNKMEYAFSSIEYKLDGKPEVDNSFALGSKKRGTWWIVENLAKDSGIFDAEFEDNLHKVTEYLEGTGLPAWHPPKKEGFYRYFTVRKSYYNNQLLINLTTSLTRINEFDKKGFVDFIVNLFGDRVAGIIHTINDSLGERAGNEDNTYEVLFGENRLEEHLLDLSFDVSIQSFFQTNPKSAERLYAKVIDYVMDGFEYTNEDNVMDLFCGTGTIGQLIAKKTGVNVVGVDIVEEAIENAKVNAQKNEVENTKFFAADVGKFLKEYPDYNGKIKTIVLDPPRGGIAPKTLDKVIAIDAERIVYVSCNPATQSRDIEILKKGGYRLDKISLVDQFPHTSHIESIALFNRIN